MTIHDAWTKDIARRIETAGDLIDLAVERISGVEGDPLLSNGVKDEVRALRKQLDERLNDVEAVLKKLRGGPREITESVDEQLAKRAAERNGQPVEAGT